MEFYVMDNVSVLHDQDGVGIYDYAAVAGNRAKPLPITYTISDLLKSNRKAWVRIQGFMSPPGLTGSRSFDHANVAIILREYLGDRLKGCNDVLVYNCFVRAVRDDGFKVQHGRITGLLEKKPAEETPLEPGEPDVE